MSRGWFAAIVLMILCAALSALGAEVVVKLIEFHEWSVFVENHDCHVIGADANKTGYRCDDGITYWR